MRVWFSWQTSYAGTCQKSGESLLVVLHTIPSFRYLKQNARKSSHVSNITNSARNILHGWLEADNKLYSHFVKKINRHIDRYQVICDFPENF